MAGKRKVIKKKLKEPDEFISLTEHAFRFIGRHYRRMIMVGAILAVLGIAFFLFQKWEEKKEAEASRLLGLAMEAYAMAESPYREGSSADLKSLRERFDELVGKFPRTSSGKLSLLYKGNLHLRSGEFDNAVKAYETFLRKSGKERLYRLLAMEGLGYAYEGKKDCEKAIEIFQKMLEAGEGPEVAAAYLGKGRCYEKLGKRKEAAESYRAFLSLVPKSVMANVVSRRISDLEE